MNLSLGPLELSMSGTAIMVIFGTLLPLLLIMRKKKEVRDFDEDTALKVQSAAELKRVGKKAKHKGRKVVACVDISGVILTSQVGGIPIMPGKATYGEEAAALIDHLQLSPFVDAVVVYLSTPGGTVPGSRMIFDAINRCRQAKPVYAYIKDMSASGGVMAMVGASEVIAAPGSLTGSIGVIGPTLMRYKGVTEQKSLFGNGVVAKSITGTTVYAGQGKNLGDPYASDEEFEKSLDDFKEMIELSYANFVELVAASRKIDPMVLRHHGAQIFLDIEAKALKLIDDIMPITAFKEHVAKGLQSSASDVEFVSVSVPQPRKTGLQRLLAKAPVVTNGVDTQHDLQQVLRREMQLVIEASHLHR